jgi:ethanolamine utilization protein EutN
MQIGLVLGTATATVKHPTLQGERMLLVQLLGTDDRDDGEPVLVFDRLGAGRGDRVMVTNDGRVMQEMLGRDTPARWSVLGLPDER